MTVKVGEIEVEVVCKKIKHMHLYVQPPDGKVLVTAPESVTPESATFFVRDNFGWVLKQREAFLSQRRQPPREYVSGETYYVWGRQCFLTVKKQKGWGGVKISGQDLTMLAPEESTVKSRGAYMDEWYRRILADELVRILPVWEKKTGLVARRFDIAKMSRSWGSCLPKKGLVRFNLQLARKPKEALAYVVLHELCHLKVNNHGKAFVAMLDEYMPNWREVRARLNDAPLDFVLEEEVGSR